MSRQSLPTALMRALAAAGAAAAVVALAACGSEQPPSVTAPGAPQTVASEPASGGLSVDVNSDVDVINARVPVPSAGSTTAQLEVTMASTNIAGPDTLRSVTSPVARAVVLTSDGHAVTGITVPVANGSSVSTGPPNPDRIMLTGLSRPLRAGQSVTISLVFARAGRATLQVPVVPAVP